MGTILTVAGVDFSANAIGYNAPNVRGLTGLFLLGGTQAKSLKNLASGGVAASLLNSPTINADSISGSYNGCVFTATINGTLMTVTSVDYGTITPGAITGAAANQAISTFGTAGTTGTGGTGTYEVTVSQTMAATKLSSGNGLGGCIVTPVADTASMTLIVAAQVPVTPTAYIDGAYLCGSVATITGVGISGLGIFFGTSGAQGYVACEVSGAASAHSPSPVTPSSAGAWNMYALVVDSVGDTYQLVNLTTGNSPAAQALPGPFIPSTAYTQRIGSSPSGSAQYYGAECNVALFESHNVALTGAELSAIYAAYKPVLASRGIAV